MKAKDTVMHDDVILQTIHRATNHNEIFQGVSTRQDRAIAKAQAEISFKAGYEQALKDNGIKQ